MPAKFCTFASITILIYFVICSSADHGHDHNGQGSFKDETPIIDHDRYDHGWNLDYTGSKACEVPDSVCNIDRIDAASLSKEEFERLYKNKKPVIITNGSKNLKRKALFSRESLLEHYKDVTFPVGTSSTLYNGKGQRRKYLMTLQEYLDVLDMPYQQQVEDGDERLYLFEWAPNLDPEATNLLADFETLPYFDFGHSAAERIIAIGQTGAGIPYHFHGQAWNEAIIGRKRWFLYPPDHPPFGGYVDYKDQSVWLEENYPKIKLAEDKPHECFQLAGDIVYVPEGWYHATINCGQTIAVASQIQHSDQAGSMSHFSNAMTLLQTSPERALDEMEKAYEVMPKNDMVLYQLGKLYGKLGMLKDAKETLAKAVKANPLRSDAWLGYALATIQSGGDNTKVLELLEKALQLNPPQASRVPIYTLMSHIYVNQGNNDKVEETSRLLDEARMAMLNNPPNQMPMQWKPKAQHVHDHETV